MGRLSHEDALANTILYTYPCGLVDIICASDKVFVPEGYEAGEDYAHKAQKRPEPAKREKGAKAEGADARRSMRRAKAQLRRLALANDFSYFVTLTLDAKEVDRYDGAAIIKRFNSWASNMVQRAGMQYIIVPEQHKDGAWHFHGLIDGRGLEFADSGTIRLPGSKKPRKPRSRAERERWLADGGKVVYNMPQWGLGYSTAMMLSGEYPAAVAYVCKYIGKQAEGVRPLGRWYYSGGALAKPEKTYAALEYRELQAEYGREAYEVEIPGSKILVIHTKGEQTDVRE